MNQNLISKTSCIHSSMPNPSGTLFFWLALIDDLFILFYFSLEQPKLFFISLSIMISTAQFNRKNSCCLKLIWSSAWLFGWRC